jgi:cytoskeletal protein CcmA (bactofilin family)
MFNRDSLFGKKEENPRNDARSDLRTPVNVTPGLGTSSTPVQRPTQHAPIESPKTDVRLPDASAKVAGRAEEPTGSRLIVGPDIKLKGVEITDCDTLVVEGRVEASMDSRVVQIAENGVFSGTVSIDVAEIRGRFEGELTARDQLVIYASGKVSGRIRYGKIRIEEGGELTGEVSTLGAAAAGTAATAGSSSTASPVPSPGGLIASTAGAKPGPAASPAPASESASAAQLASRKSTGKAGAGINTV